MNTRTKDLLLNAGLLTGTILVFFGGIEVALRVTGIEKGKPYPPPIFQSNPNPDISYELKPNIREKAYRNIVTTDEHGFRSAPVDPTKKTIAVLGDSMTFGYGVADSETIPAQLSEELNGKYNVLNTGVPGYNLRQEAATYAQKVAPLNPSALVLMFYWNDLGDMIPGRMDSEGNVRSHDWKDSDAKCNPIQEGLLGYIPGKCWLDTHSAFYRTVKKLVIARQGRTDLAKKQEEAAATLFTETLKDENVELYKTQLRTLASTLPPAMPKLFVIIPDAELHFTLRPKIRSIAEAEGFTVLDLYSVFGNRADTLSWDTVHWNARTSAEAAAVIAAAMNEWKLLP